MPAQNPTSNPPIPIRPGASGTAVSDRLVDAMSSKRGVAPRPSLPAKGLPPKVSPPAAARPGSPPTGEAATSAPEKKPTLPLGEILIKKGLITGEQLEEAINIQTRNPDRYIGAILVDRGYISQHNLDAVLRVFNKRFRFGQLLVREKAIQEPDLAAALQEQERTNNAKKVGEILIERELITEPMLNRLLSRHLGIPYLSLKELTIDESMAKLDVSMQYMAKNNLVPFSFQDDVLIVAMSDPTNKELINDL
ncbi:MAG: hypothetical protein HQK60_17805, partial [Deltaproteobacteria bacterium]|nr:hypothetical protein [Deltaproteobacteria bacterium]